MEINKCNQLVLTESDELLEEQFECPVCKNSKYSSLYMEKISSKNMLG